MLSSKYGFYNKNNPALLAQTQREYAMLPPSLRQSLSPQYKLYEKIMASDSATLKHLTVDEVYVPLPKNWRKEMEDKMALCQTALKNGEQIRAAVYYRDAYQILASAEKEHPEQLDDEDLHLLIDYRFNQLVNLYKAANGQNKIENYQATLLTLDRLLSKVAKPNEKDRTLKTFVDKALTRLIVHSFSEEKLGQMVRRTKL